MCSSHKCQAPAERFSRAAFQFMWSRVKTGGDEPHHATEHTMPRIINMCRLSVPFYSNVVSRPPHFIVPCRADVSVTLQLRRVLLRPFIQSGLHTLAGQDLHQVAADHLVFLEAQARDRNLGDDVRYCSLGLCRVLGLGSELWECKLGFCRVWGLGIVRCAGSLGI